jgi:DNA-directed RNA polymerase subunit RPC12/RpoP
VQTREPWSLGEDDCPARAGDGNLTCSGCGTTFQTPILATVSISGQVRTYYACPRCMTKVASFKVPKKVRHGKEPALAAEQDRPTAKQEPASHCTHFFGYLNKHQKSTPFPDECLTCPKMVECMLLH